MTTQLLCTLAIGLLQPSAVELSAKFDADELKVGQTYQLEFKWDVTSESAVDQAGVPVPLIQIDVPDSIELVGKELKEHKELSKNEFLYAPFERALESKTESIEFKLISAPAAGDHIAINFIAYSTAKDGTSQFIRKRLAVPVVAKAEGKEVEIGDAAWGRNNFGKIGEQVKPISIPQADGTKVDLGDILGKSNLIITTYRAFW